MNLSTSKKVYIDANIIIDFSVEKRIFCLFIENNSESKFSTSSYIIEKEVNQNHFLQQLLQHINVDDIDLIELEIFARNNPNNLDYGELSLYYLATNNANSCIMTNDKKARNFFESKGLLPCQHLNPPVGGTRGLIEHLIHHNYLSEEEAEEIKENLKQKGRRI